MSLPGKPVIRNAPRASPNTLEYYWFPPTSTGGNPIEGYQISLNSGAITCNIAASELSPTFGYYKVTGLTNATTYFTTIAASTINGYGPTANFRAFQPGSLPLLPPSTTSIVVSGQSNALLSWTPPITLPDATIFWYVIKSKSSNPSDPVLKYTANGQKQSSYFVKGLNPSSTYYFTVNAVNCPGYSPQLSTATITFNTTTPFYPTQLSGLQLWLDASDATTLTLSGSNVTAWTDKNTPAKTTTISATKPVLITGGLNSSNTIRFTGTSLTTVSATLGTAIGTGNISMYAVWKPNTGTGTQAVTGVGGLSGANGTIGMGWHSSGKYLVYDWAVGETTYSSAAGSWVVELGQRQTNQLLTTVNGNLSDQVASSTNYTNTAMTVGGGPGYYATGEIGETLFYNTFITPFNRQKVEGYLAWKWGIQSNLPTSHPFRSAAPMSNSVFAPTSFNSIRLWIDAQDATTVTITGVSTITQLRDKTTNSYVFSNVSGYAYTPSTFNTSYPSFTGLGTSGSSLGSNGSFTLAQPITAFFVGKNDKIPVTFGFIYCSLTSNTNSLFYNNNDRYSMYATGQVDSLNIAGTSQSNILISAVYNGASSAFVQNGSTIVTGINPGTGGISGLILGQRLSLDNFAWGGKYCELLMYQGNLATQDRQTVEGYLAWKWGLQGNLPLSHPYVLNNPGVVTTTIPVATSGLLIRFDASTYSGSGQWINTGSLGTSYNATITAGQTPAKNTAGNGIVLNGSCGWTFSHIGLQTNYTLSSWFKLTDTMGSDYVAYVTDSTNSGGTSSINMALSGRNSGISVGTQGFAGGSYIHPTWRIGTITNLNLNQWYMLTVSFDNTSKGLATYINGINVGTTTVTGFTPATAGLIYRIGQQITGTAAFITGEVGQVLIYNRALTATEVLQNYGATSNTFSV